MALEDSPIHANDDYHDHNFCETAVLVATVAIRASTKLSSPALDRHLTAQSVP
jgi:hypothetical protein